MRLTFLIPILVGGWIPTLGLADAPPWERINGDLVTHNSIVIDRPAGAIWPLIVDVTAWKRGATLRHLSGTRGQVGEIFEAMMNNASTKPLFYMQNIELVDHERRTVKLYAIDSGPLIGYASWELQEFRGKTRVSYDVYGEIPLPADNTKETAQNVAEQQALYTAENKARFQAELQELKRLIESQPVGGH